MGQPQKRWRESSQSRSRKLTRRSPTPVAPSQSIAAAFASATDRPLRSGPPLTTAPAGEFTWGPSPLYAVPSHPSGRCTVSMMGNPKTVAKSRSRWSSPGTAMTAPVP